MPKKSLVVFVTLTLMMLMLTGLVALGNLAKYERTDPIVRTMLESPSDWLHTEKDLGAFNHDLSSGEVAMVGEGTNLYLVTLKNDTKYFVFKTEARLSGFETWLAQDGKLFALHETINPNPDAWSRLAKGFLGMFSLGLILPLLLIVLVIFQLRTMVGPVRAFSTVSRPDVRFRDVIGVREAKRELGDMVLALRDNAAYTRVNAAPPRGVLLSGPPGTGKTLLAKALAGESGASFIAIVGSDFSDKFLGNGISKVKKLFATARANAPCVIFIDEIDGIGRRSSDDDAASMENNRIINALLSEMDGFTPADQIVVLGATNHPDNVDAALKREGRFDRKCTLSLPPLEDRKALFELYARKVPSVDVDFGALARRTTGMAPAAIAATVMAAARFAARENSQHVTHDHFLAAVNQQLLGAPTPEVVMSDAERERCAYHEAGHAIVAHALAVGTVEKVTVMPHSQALGVTLVNYEEDRHLMTQAELESRIEMLLAGRAAEITIYGAPSNGASNDLERASQLAYRMVTEFGFSPEYGPFNGAALGRASASMADFAVGEARALLKKLEARCLERVTALRGVLETLTKSLLDNETVEGAELHGILSEAATPA
jgi:cell division protease FtsH